MNTAAIASRHASAHRRWILRTGTVAVIGAMACMATMGVKAEPAAAAGEAAPANSEGAVANTAGLLQTFEQIVVLARSRQERTQDVPIPVTAVSGKVLEREGAVSIQDFAKLAPNLLVQAPNARQTSISIRGVGKNTANDALEPSVGVIIDGVPLAFINGSWGDLTDLDHVAVLRGPQGTLMGKNTTLGVINIVTRGPRFKPETNVELSTGAYHKIGVKAAIGGSILDNVLAYRLAVFSDKRDGPFTDIAPGHTNQTFQDRNRSGFRLQFLLLPTAETSVRLIVDRQRSAEMGLYGDPPLFNEPASFANGASRTAGTGLTFTSRLARPYFGPYQPLIGDWDHVVNIGSLPTISESNGVSADVSWNLQENLTLSSVTAYRDSLFDAHNAEWVPFDIRQYGAIIKQKQTSQELRLNGTPNAWMDYTLGLYLLDSTVDSKDRTLYGVDAGAFYATAANYNALRTSAVGNRLLQDSLRGLFLNTPTHPNTRSAAEFGQLNLHLSDRASVTLGLRRTDETKINNYQKFINGDAPLLANLAATTLNAAGNATAGIYSGATAAEIAAAKNIRTTQASNLGTIEGGELKATSYAWLINPSYKLDEDTLLYTSLGRGEKSGSVQFNSTKLQPQYVAPEKALDAELGVRATLLNRKLVLGANLYATQIKDYQQNLTVVDPLLSAQNGTTTYRSYLGNVKGVRLRGLEVEGAFTASRQLRITFSGAYNQAIYSDFAEAPCPSDVAAAPGGQQQCDFTHRRLPFAPKFSGNVGVDYQLALGANFGLHAYTNLVHRGSANYNAGLAQAGEQAAYQLIDGGIGITSGNGKWELALVGKNLADRHFVTNIGSYSSTSATTATPGERRYVGLVLRAKL
jgi:iron complex outermembrane receptor protein